MPNPVLPVSADNRPQIVATAGPKSFERESELVFAGATSIRLNASHLSADEVYGHVVRILAEQTADCVIDLQGGKMRLSAIEPLAVTPGQLVRFSCDPSEKSALYVPHPELFEQVVLGETLSLDDGRLSLEVVDRADTWLLARTSQSYVILPRKGINREHHPIEIADLGAVDQAILSQCALLSRVRYAISFVKDGSEAKWVRSRVANAKITLKVERQEALDNLDTLASLADELWICRGDLGAQLGLNELGRVISLLEPRRYRIPVLMAGQVFEHLTYHDTPTRSEICHLYELQRRGYDGIVLSDETAIGVSPNHATAWARRLLDAFER
jgi:pyruvate kinase